MRMFLGRHILHLARPGQPFGVRPAYRERQFSFMHSQRRIPTVIDDLQFLQRLVCQDSRGDFHPFERRIALAVPLDGTSVAAGSIGHHANERRVAVSRIQISLKGCGEMTEVIGANQTTLVATAIMDTEISHDRQRLAVNVSY